MPSHSSALSSPHEPPTAAPSEDLVSIDDVPPAIADEPSLVEQWRELDDDDRARLTPDVLGRWLGELRSGDVALVDVAEREAARLANVKTFKQSIELTDQEWAVFRFLGRRAGQVVTYAQIAHHLWGSPDRPITARMLRSQRGYTGSMISRIQNIMCKLRAKIEIDPLRPQHFAPVRSVGYTFYDAPPSQDDQIDYRRRSAEHTAIRAEFRAELLGDALPSPSTVEHVDAPVIDASSSRIRTGPEFERVVDRGRRNRRGPASVGDDGSQR